MSLTLPKRRKWSLHCAAVKGRGNHNLPQLITRCVFKCNKQFYHNQTYKQRNCKIHRKSCFWFWYQCAITSHWDGVGNWDGSDVTCSTFYTLDNLMTDIGQLIKFAAISRQHNDVFIKQSIVSIFRYSMTTYDEAKSSSWYIEYSMQWLSSISINQISCSDWHGQRW